MSSRAHFEELHDPHILHLRLHTLPNLKSMNFSVGSLSGVQSVRLVFILYMLFCLFEVLPASSSCQQLWQPAGRSLLRNCSLNLCMYSVSWIDFRLCSYTLTPGTLPLYRQQGEAPPLTSTSKCVHGNGHTFDFIYLSTNPTPFRLCSISLLYLVS